MNDNFDEFKNNLLKSLDLSKIPTYTPEINISNDFEKQRKEIERSLQKKQEKEEKFKNDVLAALNMIVDNTANLTAVVQLLHEGNEKQEEIFEIVTDILSMAKENTKEKVESSYRRILNRINSFTGDVDTITKLIGYATASYNVITQLLK